MKSSTTFSTSLSPSQNYYQIHVKLPLPHSTICSRRSLFYSYLRSKDLRLGLTSSANFSSSLPSLLNKCCSIFPKLPLSHRSFGHRFFLLVLSIYVRISFIILNKSTGCEYLRLALKSSIAFSTLLSPSQNYYLIQV